MESISCKQHLNLKIIKGNHVKKAKKSWKRANKNEIKVRKLKLTYNSTI